MKKFTQHILFKYLANLVITGTVFIVLFGNGVHLHSIFDHFFDHGDLHVILHAHPTDDHHTESRVVYLDNEDHHQHPIASIDVNGTLTQSARIKIVPEANVFALVIPEQVNSVLNNSPPTLLVQPPPPLKFIKYHFFSFSLRAPPVA